MRARLCPRNRRDKPAGAEGASLDHGGRKPPSPPRSRVRPGLWSEVSEASPVALLPLQVTGRQWHGTPARVRGKELMTGHLQKEKTGGEAARPRGSQDPQKRRLGDRLPRSRRGQGNCPDPGGPEKGRRTSQPSAEVGPSEGQAGSAPHVWPLMPTRPCFGRKVAERNTHFRRLLHLVMVTHLNYRIVVFRPRT